MGLSSMRVFQKYASKFIKLLHINVLCSTNQLMVKISKDFDYVK